MLWNEKSVNTTANPLYLIMKTSELIESGDIRSKRVYLLAASTGTRDRWYYDKVEYIR